MGLAWDLTVEIRPIRLGSQLENTSRSSYTNYATTSGTIDDYDRQVESPYSSPSPMSCLAS